MPWAKCTVTGGCILLAASLSLATGNALAEPTPVADHHIHIQSEVVTNLLGELKKSMPGAFEGLSDAATLEALKLLGAAIASEAPGTANLVFDLSGVSQLDLSSLEGIPMAGIDAHTTEEWRTLFLNEMRKVGLDRFVLASDWPALTPPTEYFITERKELPVTDAEWAELCGNVAPDLRAQWIASRAGTD